jgi:hypothetical protein
VNHPLHLVNPCRMNTYRISACKPCIINTYKTLDLKSFRMNTYKNKGEGVPPTSTHSHAIAGFIPNNFVTLAYPRTASRRRPRSLSPRLTPPPPAAPPIKSGFRIPTVIAAHPRLCDTLTIVFIPFSRRTQPRFQCRARASARPRCNGNKPKLGKTDNKEVTVE